MTIDSARRRSLGRLAGVSLAATAVSPAVRAANPEDPMGWAPRASLPSGYPESYLGTIRAAEEEGQVTIYSTTDAQIAEPLIADFRALYPRIAVDFDDQTATELNARFVAESRLGRGGADVLWSSAMDQQAALIERGMAQPYDPVHAAGLPSWARLGNLGWSTTLEPIAIVYDRGQLPPDEAPTTHRALRELLEKDPRRFDRRIVLYDVLKSGVGYLLATHDAAQYPDYLALVSAIGRCRPRLVLTADAMLRSVEGGTSAIGYNVLGDYALARATRSSTLAIVFPADYTLVLSRVMFISRMAAHPNAARLWVDYLLSPRGQQVLADRSRLHAVRDDVTGDRSAGALRAMLGQSQRPIPFDTSLARALDEGRYAAVSAEWRRAIGRPVGSSEAGGS